MNNMTKFVAALIVCAASAPSFSAERDLSCSLTFSTKQWSVIYMQSEGTGTVKCKDGSTLPVKIGAKGIGITAGKWTITNGSGTFTHVRKIEDVLGRYADLSVDAGAHKSGTAQLLTKGKVSLAVDGTGDGFDVGIAVSEVNISRQKPKK